MIVGVGTDIVAVERLDMAHRRFGERLAVRLLAVQELEQYHCQRQEQRHRFLARRFAAKEAAVKALGTGFQRGIGFSQIEVEHDELGQPQLCWSGAARTRFDALGVERAYLSISDELHYAVAFVVLERGR